MRAFLRSVTFCIAVLSLAAPFSRSQMLYATGENAMNLVEVNMSTSVVTKLSTLTTKPDSLIIDSLGRILYTTTKPGTVSMFNPSTNATTVVASGLSYPRDMVFDPGQASILVSNYGLGQIVRVNLTTGTVTILATKLGTVDGLAYDPSGQLFAIVKQHTQIIQLDPNTGAVLNTLTVVTNQAQAYYGLDGLVYDTYTGHLWAAESGTGANCLVEIPTDLSSFSTFQVGKLVNPDGLTSDGQGNLFVGVALARISQYNIPTNTIVKSVKVPSVDDVAMVP